MKQHLFTTDLSFEDHSSYSDLLVSHLNLWKEWQRGALNHESREINEFFHDSRKIFEGFYVSRKISAGWSDYCALGTTCNNRMVQGSTLVGVQGVKPPETSEIWHFRGTK